MEFQENFKILNYEIRNRKDSSEQFIILNVLDINNNPCKFFVFKEDVIKKFRNTTFVGLQDVFITFKLSYNGSIWSVTLLDIE